MFALLMAIFLVAVSGQAAAAEHHAEPLAAVFHATGFEFSIPADDTSRRERFQIPIILNDSVEAYIEYYRSEKKMFQKGLDNSISYIRLMKETFRKENVPEELVYVVMIESWFNPAAVSRVHAVGPWQFMPETARQYGLKRDQWVDERRDALKSTRAAARYFKTLHARLRSWPLVLAAYNAGIGKVRRAMIMTRSDDFWDLKESDYLGKETKSFVPKIMAAVIIAQNPASYGFRPPDPASVRFDAVIVGKKIDLRVLANDIDTTYRALKALNPELNGRFTPPGHYLLKIPAGKSSMAARSIAFRKAALDMTRIRLLRVCGLDFGRGAKPSLIACSLAERTIALSEPGGKRAAEQNSRPVLFALSGTQRKTRGRKQGSGGPSGRSRRLPLKQRDLPLAPSVYDCASGSAGRNCELAHA